LKYLGFFKVPDDPSGTRFGWADADIAVRNVNGSPRLFITGSTLSGEPLYEINYPGTGLSLSSAPTATLLSNYGDVYQNRRLTHQPDEQGVQTGGLLWDAARQGLWIAYGGVYNVAAFHDPSIMFVSFAGSSPVAYGPWRTSQHSQRTRDYMVMLDSGQPAVGAAPHSGNANSPAGS
jgi:hypothetical protein